MGYDDYMDYLKDQADAAEEDAHNRAVEEERDRECIRTLAAERDQLRAEVERLRGEVDKAGDVLFMANDTSIGFAIQITTLTARAEAAEALLRGLAAIINPHEPYNATKIAGWARDTVERAREADGAEAHVADLRGALHTLNHAAKVAISTQYGGSFDEDTPLVIRLLDGTCDDTDAALARTPAQSLARCKAEELAAQALKAWAWVERVDAMPERLGDGWIYSHYSLARGCITGTGMTPLAAVLNAMEKEKG